jgi:hypothetical protein
MTFYHWRNISKYYNFTHFYESYWDVYKSNWRDNITYSIKQPYRLSKTISFYFTLRGYCEKIEYHGNRPEEIRRIATSQGDVLEDPVWTFFGQDSINIRGYKYKILKFEGDSLVLKWHNMAYPDTLFLVRSKFPR